MPAGLQIWDAAGRVILDTNDQLGRVIGSIIVHGSGAMNVPEFNLGRPFPFSYVVNSADLSFRPAPALQVNISGTTLSWSVKDFLPSTYGVIFYGVY